MSFSGAESVRATNATEAGKGRRAAY